MFFKSSTPLGEEAHFYPDLLIVRFNLSENNSEMELF